MILPKDLMLGGELSVQGTHLGNLSSFQYHSNRLDLLSDRTDFEFDLNLLDCEVPSLEITDPLPTLNLDCQVPSPSGSYDHYSSSSDMMSPMMFSPGSTSSISSTTSAIKSSPIKSRPNPYQRVFSSLDSPFSPLVMSDSVKEFRQLQASVNVKIEPINQMKNDTPLLRQYLIQERIPVVDEDVKIEPVISMAVEQVKRDIQATCNLLCIGHDPCLWSKEDVARWIQWTMQHYGILAENPFDCDGSDLVKLTENDFLLRLPEGGDLLYAQMDIWRSSAEYNRSEMEQILPPPEQFVHSSGNEGYSSSSSSIKNESRFDISAVLDILDANSPSTNMYETNGCMSDTTLGSPCSMDGMNTSSVNSPSSICTSPPPPYSMAISQLNRNNAVNVVKPASNIPPEDEETDDTDDDDIAVKIPTIKTSTTNIHLWQFVKELLLHPDLYSGCIHWMDREKGIFKIVDSVKVATLWGKRKNRPAMNYDKLSRSLRQYYKKGIMKKTERSQRLVYQFCHPYHL
ncbi:transcription factor ets-4 isoform X2 [Lepeophtheirus salmonis]|uniref:Ets at 98B CG5583PAlike [Tribolium castaneum] n=1 Tax=Lepeophtheirus salmonis TaxID=72036 RepID=A0A0K2UW16_LEPSM|nr:DNA-binding protein D-ETS-4-like isoform X2 [Lepeophtheirus salmonis]